jgi:hypothetical protein
MYEKNSILELVFIKKRVLNSASFWIAGSRVGDLKIRILLFYVLQIALEVP